MVSLQVTVKRTTIAGKEECGQVARETKHFFHRNTSLAHSPKTSIVIYSSAGRQGGRKGGVERGEGIHKTP